MADSEQQPGGVAKAGKRLLAVAALGATIFAIVTLVSSWEEDSGDEQGEKPQQTTTVAEKEGEPTPKEYVIQPGDTLLAIADRYGISLKRIERLNPNLDDNTLSTGDLLTLR